MIRIRSTRFGDVDVADEATIVFEGGLFGFPQETEFVLLEHPDSKDFGYLQSKRTAWLAFPVMDATLLAPAYPVPNPSVIAEAAGLGTKELAMLLILIADAQGSIEVNLLAPLVIDLETRKGAQVMLDPTRYSSRFSLRDGETKAEAPNR
ncbi:MAG: flagellar assembly protein FliW [Myxococcales bacterium]|nr:flagellar assembly protein FliW [Myxococcales bacterium]